jgi:hypothetical protein
MIKHFCDLCGNPAVDAWPRLRVAFPNMEWRGTKSDPGSISNVDGTWTPYVEARVVFDAHDMPRSMRSHNPDICAPCIVELLRKMADSITQPPTGAAEQREGVCYRCGEGNPCACETTTEGKVW